MTDDQWMRLRKCLDVVPAHAEMLLHGVAEHIRDELEPEELTELTGDRDEAWWPEDDEGLVKACELYVRLRP